eukprot:158986-Pyramimonas_sp.AAC.1
MPNPRPLDAPPPASRPSDVPPANRRNATRPGRVSPKPALCRRPGASPVCAIPVLSLECAVGRVAWVCCLGVPPGCASR